VADLVQRVQGSLDEADAAVTRDPARAVALLERTGDNARNALAGMRTTLDRLRAEDDDGETPSRAPTTSSGGTQSALALELERRGAEVEVRHDLRTALPTVLLMAAERVADEAPELLGGPPRRAILHVAASGLRLDLRGPRRARRATVRSPGVVAAVERVRLLGGTLAVHPWSGRILLELPLAGAPAAPPADRRRAAWVRAAGRHVPVLLLIAYGLVEQSLQTLDAPLGERLALAILMPLPLLLRERRPLVALAGVQALILVGTLDGTFGGIVGQQAITELATAFTAGALLRGRLGVALAAALALAAPLVSMGLEDSVWPVRSYVAFAVMLGAAFAVGRLVSDRLAAASAARQEIALLIDRGRVAEERAAAQERARLAREIHDVVGHAVLLVCVQAGAAETLAAREPEEAREAIESARGAAGTAVIELARLSLLMPGDDAGDEPPGVADIPALVECVRGAGRDVEMWFAVSAGLPPDADGAVYRIVQEALTNAGKHAPGAPVSVDVCVRAGRACVRVTNPLDAGSAGEPRGSGGGHGLRNMRERAVAAGGSFRAGANGDDHWVVSADFPPERTERPLVERPSADAVPARHA
jgi:signal transduction histidine kinase